MQFDTNTMFVTNTNFCIYYTHFSIKLSLKSTQGEPVTNFNSHLAGISDP